MTAAWWNNDHDINDADLRDPSEGMATRRSRYVKQIAHAHGVGEKVAQGALRHVYSDISQGTVFASPVDYGFASQSHLPYSHRVEGKLKDPATWAGKEPQDVSLREPVHASQTFIRPHSVAHNLFHPGKPQPIYDETVGDPDHDPDWDRDGMDEEEGDETPEEKALGEVPRFMRRSSGRLDQVDGHHRTAADMLLGKSHTRGVVIHERDLEG